LQKRSETSEKLVNYRVLELLSICEGIFKSTFANGHAVLKKEISGKVSDPQIDCEFGDNYVYLSDFTSFLKEK